MSGHQSAGEPPTTPTPVFDLYANLFADQQRAPRAAAPLPSPLTGTTSAPRTSSRSSRLLTAAPAPPPRSPSTLADSGLPPNLLSDLILKMLYLHSNLQGSEVARLLRVPFPVVDEGLRLLKDQRCIEVATGDLMGRVSYKFAVTDLGRQRARDAFEQCRYVGPAPVSLAQYVAQCRLQTVTGTSCTPEALKSAFQDFVIREGLLEDLGPAVCSGRSIFVYGPPGNGKTMIAKGLGNFLNLCGGEIYVPYALHCENSIITIFDPVVHQAVDDAEHRHLQSAMTAATGTAERTSVIVGDGPVDLRWRRIRRPVIITGGELTLDMLELQYNQTGNFYAAPLHIRANGGVFLIDDFGRQRVSPRDLLNRWILPLEEKVDYLSPVTGRKFSVPFEQLIIFSTNLDPKELTDEAFLRRIRHKIRIDAPNRDMLSTIFELVCAKRKIVFSRDVIDYLYEHHYGPHRQPRNSDARDLVEIADSICRFQGAELKLTRELFAECCRRFFSMG